MQQIQGTPHRIPHACAGALQAACLLAFLCPGALAAPGVAIAPAGAAPASAPASAPAPLDECTSVIDFAIPGSAPNSTSHAMIVVPHAYLRSPTGRYPVVYMLHGYAASYLRYHEKLTQAGRTLTELADRFNTILVMPDGRCCSWYLDAPADSVDAADWQYETIITRHAMVEIDRRFRTWPQRSGRGVTGISMGGFGALYLAVRNPDLFAAATSMSGIMDLRESTHPEEVANRLGTFEQHCERWMAYSVVNLADKFLGQDTGLLLDVGWEDPFVWSNRAVHDKLLRLNVPHDYIERRGRHEWAYWINALPYHLQFLADRLKPADR